jgi:hypothetical protein
MALLSALPRALICCVLVASVSAVRAQAHADRIASIGESPHSAEPDAAGGHGMLVDLVRALDRATNSSTRIVLRPFARSLKETAAGMADFHLPLIQSDAVPAPEGLVFVTEVDFGHTSFVVYSRKLAPLDAQSIATARQVEIESGHEAFFAFPVAATHCVPCSLDKVLLGRADALIAPANVVDPLLKDPRYRDIHRALFGTFPVRALVPAKRDSSATRRYLVDGVTRLKQSGEFWAITGNDAPYSDWQP